MNLINADIIPMQTATDFGIQIIDGNVFLAGLTMRLDGLDSPVCALLNPSDDPAAPTDGAVWLDRQGRVLICSNGAVLILKTVPQ